MELISKDRKNSSPSLVAVRPWLTKLGLEGQQLIILVGLILLIALFSAINPDFLSYKNFEDILRMSSIYGIAALGMTLVMLTGGIDLSVGSVMALGGALSAGFLGIAFGAANPIQLPFVLAVLLAIIITGVIGLLNGFVITKFNIAPFVATLGMMTIARGLTYIYTDFTVGGIPGSPITFSHPLFDWLGAGYIAGIPTQAVIFIVLALVLGFVLRHTALGRNVYAVGGNGEISRLAGINKDWIVMIAYMAMGVLAGLSGLLLTGKLSSASPLTGTGYELDIITIVVLGGTSMIGGRASIFGTVLGALILSVITNGLNFLNVPSFYQYLIKGTILVAAVIFDQVYQRRVNHKKSD
ncbi:ABC transporter permease [Bacillus canaveralius]|uniref:ABC transporter permease n=1 Tax=Bacillus canaveralius TaxID=1403243 RepID=UPI000F77C920|nr:ABC transporter permease [Bacillus canaveralius]RSK54683.1 ABC transporter permease [Bacillus canaveralius]